MAAHNELGEQGELLAKNYLEEKGLTILESNWISGKAEIDLIARHDQTLIFVEVKTRRKVQQGLPEAAVNRKKAKRLTGAASAYMSLCGHEGLIRFDVVSVIIPPGQDPRINHIEDAFFY